MQDNYTLDVLGPKPHRLSECWGLGRNEQTTGFWTIEQTLTPAVLQADFIHFACAVHWRLHTEATDEPKKQ